MNIKAGGYISQIKFNNGQTLDINKDDIVIFVGPNNAGKSQSLKDIYTLAYSKNETSVVSDIRICKSNNRIIEFLDSFLKAEPRYASHKEYYYLNSLIAVNDNEDEYFPKEPYFGCTRDVFIANLDTSARLDICNPPQLINKNQPKQHPIHFAAFNSDSRKWLSDKFKKAFGIEVTPNTTFGGAIPLSIGEPVKLVGNDFCDEQERFEAYSAILDNYPQVQNQGDGIKSFTGILLYLMLDNYRTYIIDEPESFLHPPQAKIMGEIIGETLGEEQQAFISTHSDEIIKGLLEVCPNRVKIVRITRKDNLNDFSILDNEGLRNVWNDPLLRYSNIMSGLFHKSVVLCESDSDCKMYSIVENHLKQKQGSFSETLFVHCGGKHRMAKVAAALRSLNIDVKLIPDIDVLNDEGVFKDITEVFGIDWDSIEKNYNIIKSNINNQSEKANLQKVRDEINHILNNCKNNSLTNQEVSAIKEAVTTKSGWGNLKKCGENAFTPGDMFNAYKELKKVLNNNNIYIVPVGELEMFVKEVGGHGPSWVNDVFDRYPNFDDPVYNQIKTFVSSLNL